MSYDPQDEAPTQWIVYTYPPDGGTPAYETAFGLIDGEMVEATMSASGIDWDNASICDPRAGDRQLQERLRTALDALETTR